MITHDNLLSFLTTRFSVDTTEIEDDTELFTGGILDSFSVVELVLFIEGEENTKMEPTELVMENLDSIAKILRFCDSKRAGQTFAGIPS
jgi:acyl carrier protein